MISKNLLLIFDIDATLFDSGGLGRTAIEKAVEDIYGIRGSTIGIIPHGMTDKLIFLKILKRSGIALDNFDDDFERFCERYIQEFSILLQNSDQPRLLGGVDKLIRHLAAQPGIFLAVGTGNIEQSAFLKLHHHDMAKFFPVGGFGSDSQNRSEIISIAYHRAQNHYRIPFAIRDTWVIGDTPHDIQAGKDLGVNTLAVATGIHDIRSLFEYMPTALFEDLTDIERFMFVIRDKEEHDRKVILNSVKRTGSTDQ